MASAATEEYENTRAALARFIGASSPSEVVFTSGATAAINLVAFSYGEAFVGEGDEIIVTEEEHHSNIVPWQMLCQRKGASLKVLPVDDLGHLCVDLLEGMISSRTKLVAVSHVSNVLGIVNPVREIAEISHKKGVPLLVDGAQGIVHQNVNVNDLGCDFYVFSGHKLYAASGTGVLYGRKEWLDRMPPYMGGGEMIESVSFTRTTYAPVPGKFEAGTQNINSVPAFVPAIEFVKQLDDKELKSETEAVAAFMYDSLSANPRIHLFGVPRGTEIKVPLYSFTVDGVHHEDLALILDKMGVAVRSGQMCAEPLMARFGVTGMLRASLAPYNSMEEAEYFIGALQKAVNMLSR